MTPRERFMAEFLTARNHSVRGNFAQALRLFNHLGTNWIPDDRDPFQEAMIYGNLASIKAKIGHTTAAKHYFKRSIALKVDPATLAINYRNYGNFQALGGNLREARRLIKHAQSLLEQEDALAALDNDTTKLKREKLVTAGFLLRVDILEKIDISHAVSELHTLNIQLERLDAPVEQLANLKWLITFGSDAFHDSYLTQAYHLALRTGNRQEALRYRAVMLGGKPLEVVFTTSMHIASFGINSIKGVVRRAL